MGDPRRPAWLCSPTPRPWGFRGNYRAQQQHQHQTCFVVSWMSGWGMNRRIHKTTWDKKKEEQKLQLLSPDRLVYPCLSLFQCPDGAGNVAPNATVVWSKQTPAGNQSVSEGFPSLFCVGRKYVSRYEPWGFYTKYWIHVNMMKQTMWFRTEAF